MCRKRDLNTTSLHRRTLKELPLILGNPLTLNPKPCAFDPNPGMPVNPGTLPRRKVQVEAGVLGV